jgi:hypothetical protein
MTDLSSLPFNKAKPVVKNFMVATPLMFKKILHKNQYFWLFFLALLGANQRL